MNYFLVPLFCFVVFFVFKREVFSYAQKYLVVNVGSIWFVSALVFLPFFLITGLRGVNVGIDTAAYHYEYALAGTEDPVFRFSEPLFSYLLIGFSKLGVSFQGFLIFQSFCYYLAISSLLILVPARSYLVYMLLVLCFGLFSFGLSGVRQSFAISIFILSIFTLLRGGYITYLLLGVVAFFFHNSSAFIFLLAFLAFNIPVGFKMFFFGVLLSPLVEFLNGAAVYIISLFDIKQTAYFDNEGALLLSDKVPLVIWLFVIVIGMVLRYGERFMLPQSVSGWQTYAGVRSVCMWACVLVCMFFWMATSVRLMDRLGFYFIPFVSLLSAWVIGSFKRTPAGWWLRFVFFFFLILTSIFLFRRAFF